MAAVAVAALSARVLAECARDEGHTVVALDLFGDDDARAAAVHWLPIGAAGALRIDGERLLDALGRLVRRGGVEGWIAGPGLEALPDALERGAQALPLLGTAPSAMRRARDPRRFFAVLDDERIAHPPVRFESPADPAGWLLKDSLDCGGGHIRLADGGAAASMSCASLAHYYQRVAPGRSMSATFVANGRDAVVIGFNAQTVRPLDVRPYVYCGIVGPVAPPQGVADRLERIVRRLAAAFDVRGLASLDVLVDGDAVSVLELNPRPSASVELYAGRRFAVGTAAVGIVGLHLAACTDGTLPTPPPPPSGDAVRGTEIVFAPRPVVLDERSARRLAALDGCHDRSAVGTRFDAGDPLCSVFAAGGDVAGVRACLDERGARVLDCLEDRR